MSFSYFFVIDNTNENLRTALETGANDFIRKPHDPIEIEARLNSMIRLRLEQRKIVMLGKEIFRLKLDELNREIENERMKS
jgi:DNA-binding response OmpR family regulator